MKYLLNLPHTPAAQELNLDWDKINANLQIVYKKDPSSDNYVFAGEYVPDEDGIKPEEEAVIVPVSSVYAGKEKWLAGTNFANILGSSDDKGYISEGGRKIRKQWKDFFNNSEWQCNAQTNKFYDCYTGYEVHKIGTKEYACDSTIIGGHVIPGTMPLKMMEGSTIFIIPICHNHNSKGISHDGQTPGNGNGFYMQLARDFDVLRMANYLRKQQIQHLLANATPIE